MFVQLLSVSRVDVIVSAVIARVIMVVDSGIFMNMPMFVLMMMFMAVRVQVLMGVSHFPVGMFVRMAMGMLVDVDMFVLVVTLHA
jgi:hypothetical protein